MQVRLLGPIDVVAAGASRPVRGLRRTAVLAVLAMHSGELVSTDRLVDRVWGDATPSTAVNTLQRHISYLRRELGPAAAIVARPPGYLLDVADDAVDVRVAERLIGRAGRTDDPRERVRDLRAALALWRGRPLVDLAGLPWADEQSQRLELRWLEATRGLIEARLALAEHLLVLPELDRLVREYPLDEEFCGQLMVALYRSGRQADALAGYERLRRALHGELGIDPSKALRDLQRDILRQDPGLNLPVAAMTVTPAVPAQLPPAVATFAGRGLELATLDALLPQKATVVISSVSGTAGVGKSALGVYWAHRVAGRYPDGQLYVNLRGFGPARPVEPAQALCRFLEALGVPADRIPDDLDARAALYRSQLAGRRVLILLDNARDSAQVEPLLPGAPQCLVLVTSRQHLTGLVATAGAHPLNLDLLRREDAYELLARRLGEARVAAEPAAVEEIVTRCARLPLALAVLAAQAATQPQLPLWTLAAELRDSRDRWDTLTTDDPDHDVRAVFSWSYRALSPGAAELFRLIGRHPGPDLDAPAAASLAGLPVGRTGPLLAELTAANLLGEPAPGRYACHDLLHAYAAELCDQLDPEPARQAATGRLLDYYVQSTYAADRALDPIRHTNTIEPPQYGVSPQRFDGSEAAIAWLASELPALLGMVEHAAATRLDALAWQLAWNLGTFLGRQGYWHDQVSIGRLAAAAARELADPVAEARAYRMVAHALIRLSRFDDAHAQLGPALQAAGAARDERSLGYTHSLIASVWQRQGEAGRAIEHARLALDHFRAVGDEIYQAETLGNMAWSHAMLGDFDGALTWSQQALPVLRQHGDVIGEASVLGTIGHAYLGRNDWARALDCYQRSADLFHQTGDRYREAVSLNGLGDAQVAAGNTDAARLVWRQALRIFDDLDHAHAERVRAKLSAR